jgi:acyl-CoA synthetase (AMP-forming)/AMP-acid ligase II
MNYNILLGMTGSIATELSNKIIREFMRIGKVTVVLSKNRGVVNICKLIEEHKVTILPASPTFLNMILISDLHKEHDLSSLKMITYGTEIMNPSLLTSLKKEFPDVKFHQTYGLSEMGVCKVKSGEETFISLEDYKIIDNVISIFFTKIYYYLHDSYKIIRYTLYVPYEVIQILNLPPLHPLKLLDVFA